MFPFFFLLLFYCVLSLFAFSLVLACIYGMYTYGSNLFAVLTDTHCNKTLSSFFFFCCRFAFSTFFVLLCCLLYYVPAFCYECMQFFVCLYCVRCVNARKSFTFIWRKKKNKKKNWLCMCANVRLCFNAKQITRDGKHCLLPIQTNTAKCIVNKCIFYVNAYLPYKCRSYEK